jgi:hypothetical protein
MERQLGSLQEIELGHKRRYEFATERVYGSILDSACGCGYGSKMMWDAGCEVCGVDIDQATIEYAKKNYRGPDYEVKDVANLDLDEMFDWVVSFETIEHVPDPKMALVQFRKCANNLLISSPNSDFYPFNPESYKGDQYPHLRHYSPKEFDELLKSCGWEVIERYGQVKKFKPVTKDDGFFQIVVCK